MGNSNTIVLLDIDHTIFNTRLYQSLCYLKIAEFAQISDSEPFINFCHEVYTELRRTKGVFSIHQFKDEVVKKYPIIISQEELEKIFTNEEIIQQALFDDVEKTLQILSKKPNLTLGIFSAGMLSIQKAKIKSLLHLFQEEHIHINEVDKIQDIPSVLEKHKEDKIYIVDDLKKILKGFKSVNPSVVTILADRQDKKTKEDLLDFVPEYTISSFRELESIIA